ncbi:MAG: hypothetical protein ACREO2_12225, partial [Arenimonas sp.]
MTHKPSLRLMQEVADTYRLAMIGGYFYLAGWLVIAIYGKAFNHSPVIAWSLTCVLLVLAIVRRLHRPPHDAATDAEMNRWLFMHWSVVFCTTFLFGQVFLWTVVDERLGGGKTAALLSTMALGVAIAHAFAMRLRFAISCVVVIYLPGLVALWLTATNSSSALVMSIYLLYVVATLWRSHADYQHRL